MKLLYVFPHPDDESFGPAAAIAAQLREGHQVELLTLTRGGATRQRERLGLSIAEMGELRLRELEAAARALGLHDLQVLDLPDSGLAELDPRLIERLVTRHVLDRRPDVLVSYPVQGISGFADHLVCHAVVKRVWHQLRGEDGAPRRLAFFALAEAPAQQGLFKLHPSPAHLLDVRVAVGQHEREAMRRALACYESYQETIERSGVREQFRDAVWFEIHGERHVPPLERLTDGLDD